MEERRFLNWTLDHVREELDWIMQYGKARVEALPRVLCPSYIDLFPPTACEFGTCGHNDAQGWDYGWFCWCGDGYRQNSWEKCMKELEIHMWGGLHK